MAYPSANPSGVTITAGIGITIVGTGVAATDVDNMQWVSDYIRDPASHPITPYTPGADDVFTVTMSGTFAFPTDPTTVPVRALFGTSPTGVVSPLPRHLKIVGAAGMKINGGVVPIFVVLDQTKDVTIQGLNFGGAAAGGEWCQRAILVGQARHVTIRGNTCLSATGKRSSASRYLARADIFRGAAFGSQQLDATISIGSTLAGTGAFKNKIVGNVIIEENYIDYETAADSAADPTGEYGTLALARAAANWFTLGIAVSALGPTSTCTVRNNVVKNCTNFAMIGNELWGRNIVEKNIFEMAKFEAKQLSTLKPLIPFPGSSGQGIHIWAGMSYGNTLNLGTYVVRDNKIVLNAPYQMGIGVSCYSNPTDRIFGIANPQLDNALKAISITNNEIISKNAAALCGIGLYQANGCYVGQNKISGSMKLAMAVGVSAPGTGAHRNTIVGNDLSEFVSSLAGEVAVVVGPDGVDNFVQSSTRALVWDDASANSVITGLDLLEGAVPAALTALTDYMKTGWAVLPDARP